MGFGARRVMGLGLPLLQILTVSELRAVLAHEFGHFHSGDTALGPWIYKTRNAIIRTVEIVGSQSALLQLPFEGYAKLFLRITNSVSRQQEYSADQLAARVVGAKLLISGLSKIQKSGPAYTAYWQRDFIPALQAGYLLPLAQGFGMFMQAQTIVKATEKILAEALIKADTGPYDTHPPLPDRISALEKLPPGKTLSEEPAAISLLNDVQTFENKILQMMLVDKKAILTLKKLSWDDAVRTLYLPSWQTLAREHASIISGVKVSDLPEIYARAMEYLPALIAIGKVVKPGTPPELVPAGSVLKLLGSVFGCALAVKLEKLGWESSNAPGAPVIFRWEGVEIEPLNLFDQFANNLLSAEKWREICQVVKITDVELGEA